jgi:tRNA threonylcarbamoyladenosine biosynthesis protein TsaE
VVSLSGPLGAGKTEFAKGLAEGLGLDPTALASPTFTIAHELPLPPHAGRPARLVHADCFRLEAASELEGAGLDDWLGAGTLLVAEWGERFPAAFGPERLEVRIEEEADGARRVSARARGAAAGAVLSRWSARCP